MHTLHWLRRTGIALALVALAALLGASPLAVATT
jgi:hypothetical protein